MSGVQEWLVDRERRLVTASVAPPTTAKVDIEKTFSQQIERVRERETGTVTLFCCIYAESVELRATVVFTVPVIATPVFVVLTTVSADPPRLPTDRPHRRRRRTAGGRDRASPRARSDAAHVAIWSRLISCATDPSGLSLSTSLRVPYTNVVVAL